MSDPALIYPLLAGVFGAVVGSFLNVVIYRLPLDELSVMKPARSMCPSCKTQLCWFENIPILSWTFLGGKCRSCKSPIRARYVIVEALNAALFGLWASRLGQVRPELYSGGAESIDEHFVLLTGFYLIAVCVTVTYIDFDYKIIPDEITWSGMALGLICSAALPALHHDSEVFGRLLSGFDLSSHVAALISSVLGLAAGAGTVYAIGLLGAAVFKKEAMGLGDVKYLGLVGAFLGADGVLTVFFVGCVTGAVGGLLQRAVTGARYIAFGPYLSLGVILVLLYRGAILDFLLVEWPELVRSALGLAAGA